MLRIVTTVVLLILKLLLVASELRIMFSLVCKIQAFPHKIYMRDHSIFHVASQCYAAIEVEEVVRFPEQTQCDLRSTIQGQRSQDSEEINHDITFNS